LSIAAAKGAQKEGRRLIRWGMSGKEIKGRKRRILGNYDSTEEKT